MLEAKTRWKLSPMEESAAAGLAEALQVSPVVSRLLAVRGITDKETAERFLYGGAEHFYDPFLLHGMREAVERIRSALQAREKIRIYGDYDADGVSSTSLMISLMKRLGADFDFYIPHRQHEGYGLNKGALECSKRDGISLLITVDTGISARDEIAYASELGLDVIVTDHHEPPEQLPEALAVINPKKSGCPYPFKHLAGVGVAFKLAHALLGEPPLDLLEYAAIGTVADLMPLTDENRLIVKLGLERLRATTNLGLKALFGVAGIDRKTISETHIGFALAPRINASGRLDSADPAVRLLTTESEQEAEHLAFDLDQLNKERQKIVEEMAKEALELVNQGGRSPAERKVLVVAKEGWNVGVVGIVASRLLEKYYRPTIILSIDPETGMAKGSARSIAGFDLYKAMTACGELFDHYGGHQAAAGMTLPRENVAALAERLEAMAAEWLTDEDFVPIAQADLICDPSEVPLECIKQIEQLSPFGNGNPSPKFIFEGLVVQDKKTMGKEQQHLKLQLTSALAESACTIEAVGFNLGSMVERISGTARIDVLGELSVNEWNGSRRPQLILQDLRVPHLQVFDWRGNGKLAVHRFPGNNVETGVIVFDAAEARTVPEDWISKGVSLWCPDSAGQVRRLDSSEAGEDVAIGQLKDLVLWTLPTRLEDLEGLLRKAVSVVRLYPVFRDGAGDTIGAVPNRDAFKSIYAVINRESEWPADDERMWAGLAKRSGLSKQAVRFIIEVFEELEFVVRDESVYRLVKATSRRELADSAKYRRLQGRGAIEQTLIYSSNQELTAYLAKHLMEGHES